MDGSPDLATANLFSSNVSVLLNECTQNTAPTITAATGVTRQQAAGASNSSIASVNDSEDLEQNLTVTVNGGPSATVNGVTVSNLAVDAGGNVTADVEAACGATSASFTLTVTDSGNLSATDNLTVTVIIVTDTDSDGQDNVFDTTTMATVWRTSPTTAARLESRPGRL